MNLVVDTHTHTIASGHAYSTVQELARSAADNGVKMFAVTDHGPSMKGAPYLYHFGNLRVLPERIYGVRVIKGAEANIIDYQGSIDIPVEFLERLEFVMASFHDICIQPGKKEDHTQALLGVLKNPYVDAIAHPGNPQFEMDIDLVVKTAAELGKLIEVNNSSFTVRTGSEENCSLIVRKCLQYGTRMVCGSDAHISFDVGKFDKVRKLLEQEKIPERLVLGSSEAGFESYLVERKKRIAAQTAAK